MDQKHIIPKIETGRSVEAVRHIIKPGQCAEQVRRESLKETFKPITDKFEEEIGDLKDELKDLKAIKEPPAALAIEGPPKAAIEEKKTRKSNEVVNIDL